MTDLTRQDRKDIQGLILSGYKHLPHTRYVFLQITDSSQAKVWLTSLIDDIITAEPWPMKPDGTKDKPQRTLNLALTYEGLQVLHLDQYALDTFPREFIEGMTDSKRSQILGDTADSAPEQWDLGGPTTETIHLLLILNGPDAATLHAYQQELLGSSGDVGVKVVATETGYLPANRKEHFGFNDSISQPVIADVQTPNPKDEQLPVNLGEFILGYPNQYGFFPLGPAIPREKDPDNLLPDFPDHELPNLKDLGRNGSFLVYRKLAQDVANFWQFIAQEQSPSAASPSSERMIWLAAKFVGRWPSGTPLVLAPEQDNPTIPDERKNLFQYVPDDAEGLACPVAAHVRRSNPRDSFLEDSREESLNTTSRHRIIRRGTLYGEPLFDLDQLDEGNVPIDDIQDDGKPRGLQFFCFNAQIARQFEFIQQTWCNNQKFNGLYNSKDPLIGDNDGTGDMAIPQCPIRQRVHGMPRFVTVRGGSYFFFPSMTAIRFLVR